MSEKINSATLFSQGKSIFSRTVRDSVANVAPPKSPRIFNNADVLYIGDSDSVSSKSSKSLTGIVGERILTPRDKWNEIKDFKLGDVSISNSNMNANHGTNIEVQQVKAVLPKVTVLPAAVATTDDQEALRATVIIEESDSIIMNDSIVSVHSLPQETKIPPSRTAKPKSSLLNGNAVLRKGSILTMNKGSKSQLDIQNLSSPYASPRNELESSSGIPKIVISSTSNEGTRPLSASKKVRSGSHSEGYSFAGWGGTAMKDFVDHLIPEPANAETSSASPPATSESKSSSYGGGFRSNLKGKLSKKPALRSKNGDNDGQDGDVPATSPRLKSATAYRHAYALLYMNKANKNARASSKIDQFLSVAKDLQKKGLEIEEEEERLRFAAAEEAEAAVVEEVPSKDPIEEACIPQEEVIVAPQRFIRKKILPSYPIFPPPQQDAPTVLSSSQEIVVSQDMIVSMQKQIRNYTQIRDLHSPSGLDRLIQVEEQKRINIRSTNCRSVNDFMKKAGDVVSPPPSAMARKSTTMEKRSNAEKKEKKKLAFDDEVAVCVAPLPSIPPPETNAVKVIEEDPSSSSMPGNRSTNVKFPVATACTRKSGDMGEGDQSPSSSRLSMFRRKSWSTHGKRGSMTTRLSMESSLLDLASMQSQSETNRPEGSEHWKVGVKKDPTLYEEFGPILQEQPQVAPELEPTTTTTTTTTHSMQQNKSQQTFRVKPTMSVHISKRPPSADAVDILNYTKQSSTGTGTLDNNNPGRYKLLQQKQKHTSTGNNVSNGKYLLAPDTPPTSPMHGHPDRNVSPKAGRNDSLRNINLGYSIIGAAISPTNPTRPTTTETQLPSSSQNGTSRPGSAPQYSNRWRGHKL